MLTYIRSPLELLSRLARPLLMHLDWSTDSVAETR
jgi:hypothetical protein